MKLDARVIPLMRAFKTSTIHYRSTALFVEVKIILLLVGQIFQLLPSSAISLKPWNEMKMTVEKLRMLRIFLKLERSLLERNQKRLCSVF